MSLGQKILSVVAISLITLSQSQAFQGHQAQQIQSNQVADSLFNKGNVHNVYDAINGIFPGVLISKPGANPNKLADVLVRGIGTENANRFPLIVIDGVIGASIEGIDLNDIATIKLLKGAETAKYGVQGGSGVLEVTMKSAEGKGSQLMVNAFTAVESRVQNMKPASRADFIALGGADLGADTDWTDAITSTALSHVVNLTATGQSDKLNYRISGNTRLVNGILDNSGLDRFNLFGKLNYRLSSKLDFTYSGSVTRDERSIGFEEAFKDAFHQNPSQPKYFDNGNLYQAIAFDYYNPLGYTEVISKTSNEWSQIHNLGLNLNLANSVLSLSGGFTNRDIDYLESYSSDFMFGMFNGIPEREARVINNTSFNGRLDWKSNLVETQKWSYRTELGLNYQQMGREQLNRFLWNSNVEETSLETSLDFFSPDAFFTGTYNNWLDLSAYYRYENASSLGENVNGNGFGYFSLSAQMDKVFRFMKGVRLNASAGHSGTTIYQDTQLELDNSLFYNAIDIQNNDLTYERNLNREIGLEFQPEGKSYFVSATRFLRRSEGIIQTIFDRDENDRFVPDTRRQNNVSDLENKGWEIVAGANFSVANKNWGSRFALTSLSTQWLASPFDNTEVSFLPMTNRRPSRVVVGEEYNVFYAPIVLNIEDDVYTFLDVDQNGDIDIFFNDLVPVGQPLPQFWMSWTNDIEWGENKISFMVESMLGHSTINSVRRQRGLSGVLGPYNLTEEDLRVDALTNNHADIFVEESSFVRLRYISYQRSFKISEKRIDLQIVGNNLFTFTGYSGNDPTPQLSKDYNAFTRMMGIETMQRWLPSRSFTIGLSTTF